MSNDHWQLLEDIQKTLTQTSDLPNGLLSAIAERLDEALGDASRAPLDALSMQLTGLFEQLLRIAPESAMLAVRQAPTSGAAESAAYTLGQVSFAQLLAAQAAERRVDDDFHLLLQDSRYKVYVEALGRKELTGKELADLSGERVETVSRKLKLLRERGVTDFRREGTCFYNLLTPAARSLVVENMAAQPA
jgi:CRP-like cAMP-binding protein